MGSVINKMNENREDEKTVEALTPEQAAIAFHAEQQEIDKHDEPIIEPVTEEKPKRKRRKKEEKEEKGEEVKEEKSFEIDRSIETRAGHYNDEMLRMKDQELKLLKEQLEFYKVKYDDQRTKLPEPAAPPTLTRQAGRLISNPAPVRRRTRGYF